MEAFNLHHFSYYEYLFKLIQRLDNDENSFN